MKRTTIYFEPELEVLLKLETLRQKRPMAEIVRDAVHAYVTREARQRLSRRDQRRRVRPNILSR